MGLKIKTVPEFITNLGYKDENTVFSIREVSFRNYSGEVAIEWEVTTSNWVSGMLKERFTQIIPFDWQNMSFVQLLLSNSDAIHDLASSVPFINSLNGVVSFDDLQAQTVDVGV